MTLTLLEKSTQVWINLEGYNSYLKINAAIFGYWGWGLSKTKNLTIARNCVLWFQYESSYIDNHRVHTIVRNNTARRLEAAERIVKIL
jgi:hypothetical protein